MMYFHETAGTFGMSSSSSGVAIGNGNRRMQLVMTENTSRKRGE